MKQGSNGISLVLAALGLLTLTHGAPQDLSVGVEASAIDSNGAIVPEYDEAMYLADDSDDVIDDQENLSIASRAGNSQHFLRSLRTPSAHFLRSLRSDKSHFLRSLRDPKNQHFLRALKSGNTHFLRALRSGGQQHFLRSLRAANEMHFLRSLRDSAHFLRSLRDYDDSRKRASAHFLRSL